MRKGDHHEEEAPHEENLLQESTPEVGDPTQQAVLAEEEAEVSLPQTTLHLLSMLQTEVTRVLPQGESSSCVLNA